MSRSRVDRGGQGLHASTQRRRHGSPPPHTRARTLALIRLACVQVVIYYHKGKKWEERFYDGVVTEVGDSVLREWDDEDFLQVKLRVDFGDGSHEVTTTQCTHTSSSAFHNHNAHTVFATHNAHTPLIQRDTHSDAHTKHTAHT